MTNSNINIINFGVCVDNRDPALSGRIRAVFDKDRGAKEAGDYDIEYLTSLLNPSTGNPDFIKKYKTIEQLKWSEDDPHICAPFLPPFINVIPKPKENAKLIVYNPDNTTQNKEYIGPTISSPTKYEYEQYAGGRADTSKGKRVKKRKNITDSSVSRNTFAYPNNVSIDGRSNADIVFGNGEILMRAGKFIPNEKTPEFPVYNPQQSALQITNFPTNFTLEEKEKKIPKEEEGDIKYVVEYEIFNLNPPGDYFDGNVILYQVETDPKTLKDVPTTTTMGLSTPVETIATQKSRVTLEFSNQTLSGVTYLINDFLEQVDCRGTKRLTDPPFDAFYGNGTYSKKGEYVNNLGSLASNDNENLNLWPFYFRPSISFQNAMRGATAIEEKNGALITNKISLVGVGKKFGLSMSRNEKKPKIKTIAKKIDALKVDATKRQGIINAISNKIILYSHDSTITDKETSNPFIVNSNVGESGDNMGIDQTTQIKLIEKETEPLVRGDQLVKILQLMAKYMFEHEHKSPGDAPMEETKEGPTKTKVDDEINAQNFLNQNIRIN